MRSAKCNGFWDATPFIVVVMSLFQLDGSLTIMKPGRQSWVSVSAWLWIWLRSARDSSSQLLPTHVFSPTSFRPNKWSEPSEARTILRSHQVVGLCIYLHVGPEISATTWRVMCTASYLFREKANNVAYFFHTFLVHPSRGRYRYTSTMTKSHPTPSELPVHPHKTMWPNSYAAGIPF
jgi:hypothetical protein